MPVLDEHNMWMQAGTWVIDPTGRCTSTDVTIVLDFLTDHYPTEFYWNIIDKCNANAVVGSVPQSHYTLLSTTYREELCLPPGRYQLILYDTYGDGICCSYGVGTFQGLFYRDSGSLWSTDFLGSGSGMVKGGTSEMSPDLEIRVVQLSLP